MVAWKAYCSKKGKPLARRKKFRAPWESMFLKSNQVSATAAAEVPSASKDKNVRTLEELLGIKPGDSDGAVSVSVAMGIRRDGEEPMTFERMTSNRRSPNKNARVDREIDENKLMELFEANPKLAFAELDFFHAKAPPLLHLCLFQNASLALIQRVYELNPDALSTIIFGWLTPLHVAAMRLTCDDLVLRFLIPLHTEDQRCALKVPILPFVMRRVKCLKTFRFCLDYFDVTHELDYAGNSSLHIACCVGDYASIFESVGYKGCRLDIAEHLMHHYPELASRMNRHHQLPLHSLLRAINPPTDLAMRLIQKYPPCSTQNASDALRLACCNGASGIVVQELYQLAGNSMIDDDCNNNNSKPLELAFGESLGSVSGNHQASGSAIQFLLSLLPIKDEGVLELCGIHSLDYYNACALAKFIDSSTNVHTFRLLDSFLCPQGTRVLYRALFANKHIQRISMPHTTDFVEDMLKHVMLGARLPPHEAQSVEVLPGMSEFVQLLHDWLLHNDHVTHLDLSCNRVPEPEIWLKALTRNDMIQSLNLAGTSLKEAGEVLVEIILFNSNLKSLQLECTYLDEFDTLAILETLPENRNLTHISLDPESEEVTETAVQIIKDNIHLTQLDFPYFAHRECRDKECSCNVLRPYWRDVQQCCALNRVIQKHLAHNSSDSNKERFICNVVLPSTYSVSMLYGVLRLEPDLWSR